jgi:TRAP-type mannitol/chloroaromatic compound transport system substrate-binding protein
MTKRHRKTTAVRRRDVLAGVGSLAASTTVSFPTPALAQGIRQLKMVTDWPEDIPGLQSSAVRLAQTIEVATGGRIKIDVFPSGALVRPFVQFLRGEGLARRLINEDAARILVRGACPRTLGRPD